MVMGQVWSVNLNFRKVPPGPVSAENCREGDKPSARFSDKPRFDGNAADGIAFASVAPLPFRVAADDLH